MNYVSPKIKNIFVPRFCPVAMKFRDLGLGPFAPLRAGLGAPTGRESPHIAYGMSQMYGNMDQYGPYGLLKKKTSKCACMVSSVEAIQPCGCLDKRSDLEMKPVCGFGTCPLGKPSVESAQPCCLKDSKESPFFIEGFVPPRKKCVSVSSQDTKCGCQVSSDHSKCQCVVNEERNSGGCGHAGCGLAKKKGCGCQKTSFERRRGGKDMSKENIENNDLNNFTKQNYSVEKESMESTDFTKDIITPKRCSKKRKKIKKEKPGTPSSNKNECQLRLRAGMDKFPEGKDNKTEKKECTKQSIILKLKELNLISDEDYKYECCNLRLRAGMENPLIEQAVNISYHDKIKSRSKSRKRQSKNCITKETNKFENSTVKLRGGMDDTCDTTCGGNKCFLQSDDPTCEDTCPNTVPQPTCCGGTSCPLSQDDKTNKPATSVQKTFTFTTKKKKEEFEPFYIKPVPRVSFKKNLEMADYLCSMAPSNPKVGDCCNDKDPPTCEGPTKEQPYHHQKISQSYGYPAPTLSNHEVFFLLSFSYFQFVHNTNHKENQLSNEISLQEKIK